jgi:hypothetical protein
MLDSILASMNDPNSERVITAMPKPPLAAIGDFRFSNRIPSRAEAIRRLIRLGLESAKAELRRLS